jgi:3-mercaptopyruvate sulfurtransferase SseA
LRHAQSGTERNRLPERRGIERVRPLAGGFRAWRDLGYPMTALIAATETGPGTSLDPAPA